MMRDPQGRFTATPARAWLPVWLDENSQPRDVLEIIAEQAQSLLLRASREVL